MSDHRPRHRYRYRDQLHQPPEGSARYGASVLSALQQTSRMETVRWIDLRRSDQGTGFVDAVECLSLGSVMPYGDDCGEIHATTCSRPLESMFSTSAAGRGGLKK